jgi:hypothetical protein
MALPSLVDFYITHRVFPSVFPRVHPTDPPGKGKGERGRGRGRGRGKEERGEKRRENAVGHPPIIFQKRKTADSHATSTRIVTLQSGYPLQRQVDDPVSGPSQKKTVRYIYGRAVIAHTE